jgi:hypothetical protein
MIPSPSEDAQLLLHEVSLCVELWARIRRVLERHRTEALPEYGAIIDSLLRTSLQFGNLIGSVRPQIASLVNGRHLKDVEELTLRATLCNCVRGALSVHEFLLFLPRESVPADLHYFCRTSLGEHYNGSVILTSLYNAFEYSFDRALSSFLESILKVPDASKFPRGHVMELAMVDRDNPIA